VPRVDMDEKKLRQLWEAGTPLVEMAATLRMATATISQNASRLGLAPRGRKGLQDDAPNIAEEQASANSLKLAPETQRLVREADGREYLPCRGGPHDGTLIPALGGGYGFNVGRMYTHWYKRLDDCFQYEGLIAIQCRGWEI
jgi:hypothetical protein